MATQLSFPYSVPCLKLYLVVTFFLAEFALPSVNTATTRKTTNMYNPTDFDAIIS